MIRLPKWLRPKKKIESIELHIEIDKAILETHSESDIYVLRENCKASADKLIDQFFDD